MRHPRILPAAVTGLAMALLLAACGGVTEESPPADDEADQVTPQDPDEDGEAVDDDTGTDQDTPADLREFTDMAVAAAVDERGVAEEEIEVLRAEEVTWPDGARGCPEEDEMYTQALVPGYVVVLDVAGEERHYHGGEQEPPFYCEDPQEPTSE